MAQIVAGFGVPHTPIFPHFVKRDGPDCEIAKLFGAQKERARGHAARFDRDVRHRSSQHVLPQRSADLRRRHRQVLQGAERRAARRAELRRQVAARTRRAYPRRRRRRRLRRRHDAEFLGRSFDHRAVAFPHAGHASPGHSVLRQRPPAAACRPRNAATTSARRSRAPSKPGPSRCASSSWARAASRSKSADRAWRPAAPTACPIRTGRCA